MEKKRKLVTQSSLESESSQKKTQLEMTTDIPIKEETEYEEDDDPTEPAPSGSENPDEEEEEEEDDEPIEDLLEPFSKEQLITLLKEAAEKNQDLTNRIREVADEDPVHRKIFVHGLGWDTKTETLIEAFKQFGEIEDCKAVFDKITGKSKGYGFILFKSRAGAREALKQPQKKIGSRMTACQLASKGPVFGGAPITTTAISTTTITTPPVVEHTQKKIYVSNVGAELDPQKLLTFFARFGEIEEGPLGLDKFTGKPKGFCLFVYKSAESAKRALEEPHKTFEGHVLHCQKAIDGPKPGKQQMIHHNIHNNNNINNSNSRFQRNDNNGGYGGHHLNAGMNAQAGLNPSIGQALALLATQGAGLAFNPVGQALLGSLGSASGVNPMNGGGMPSGYATQGNSVAAPGTIPGYGTQLQGGYQTQQPGQGGGAGRGQYGVGQYTPYMGQ